MGRVCSDKKKEKKKKNEWSAIVPGYSVFLNFFMCRGKWKQQGNETKVVPVKIMTLFRNYTALFTSTQVREWVPSTVSTIAW